MASKLMFLVMLSSLSSCMCIFPKRVKAKICILARQETMFYLTLNISNLTLIEMQILSDPLLREVPTLVGGVQIVIHFSSYREKVLF